MLKCKRCGIPIAADNDDKETFTLCEVVMKESGKTSFKFKLCGDCSDNVYEFITHPEYFNGEKK